MNFYIPPVKPSHPASSLLLYVRLSAPLLLLMLSQLQLQVLSLKLGQGVCVCVCAGRGAGLGCLLCARVDFPELRSSQQGCQADKKKNKSKSIRVVHREREGKRQNERY